MKYITIQSDNQQAQFDSVSIQPANQNSQVQTQQYVDRNNFKQIYYVRIALATIIGIIIVMILYQINKIKSSEFFPFKSFNSHLQGQIFGKSPDLFIKWSQKNMTQYGTFVDRPYYLDKIQVGSVLDFGLTKSIDFNNLHRSLMSNLAYQLYYFQFNQSLQTKKQLTISYFKNNDQIQKYLKELSNSYQNKSLGTQFILALQLIKNRNSHQLLEIEYYNAKNKYNIVNQQQKPICIYSSEYNVLSKNIFQRYFQQIQNLNYTNFHVVYVDDYSTDGSFQAIYNYLKGSSLRVRNRIKMVHNLQKLGILGNLYFWVKKYCNKNDIVVVIDGDDLIIGRQTLKIINSVYQDPQIWYLYSKYIQNKGQGNYIKGEVSDFLKHKTSQYRAAFEWQTSHLRTYRKQLFNSIPLSSLVEYHYQKQLGVAWPHFPKTAADMHSVFAMLEVAGNNRVAHIEEYFYLYNSEDHWQKDCFREHQTFDGHKVSIKTPLQQVSKLGQKSQIIKNYKISQQKLDLVQYSYRNWLKCEDDMKNKQTKTDKKI